MQNEEILINDYGDSCIGCNLTIIRLLASTLRGENLAIPYFLKKENTNV